MTEQEKILKVSFAKCPINNRKKIFSTSKCIMPISVGQGLSIHEGEKFKAAINLINQSFKACTLLIDDTIQRHTLKIYDDSTDEELRHKAIKTGDEWLVRNANNYSQLIIPYNISRWDDWLKIHPSYPTQRALIDALYENNNTFKLAVDFAIAEYIYRYSKRSKTAANSQFDTARATIHCLEYLKEECTVMCLWALEKYDFEVYPTGRNLAMKAAYELLIKPNFPNALISVSLHFRKIPKNLVNNKSRVLEVAEI